MNILDLYTSFQNQIKDLPFETNPDAAMFSLFLQGVIIGIVEEQQPGGGGVELHQHILDFIKDPEGTVEGIISQPKN